MAPSPQFTTPPPPLPTGHTLLSFPSRHILLVTLNRPASLNCINNAQHHELDSVWSWFDGEPSLRCGIITGRGRAFCAGADLKEWHTTSTHQKPLPLPATGFGGLSRRHRAKKPIIAAINGACLGGGMEMVLNADIVVSSPSASFALPEVRVGVVALAGGLPRLARTVGRQRAMEMALTGREYSAEAMRRWGVVNEVVGCHSGTDGGGEDDGKGGREGGIGVVERAIEVAEQICGNSPDGVVVSKMGVEVGWGDGGGVEEATERVEREGWGRMEGGENMKEGLRAFVERRGARWVDSKL
ncbi:MAG: hypothetical protein LQ338_001179 [Usnochroma carphineum]|nr:MAG: hypothetical protein LQ338_001179 [Usnochroma carphineum]